MSILSINKIIAIAVIILALANGEAAATVKGKMKVAEGGGSMDYSYINEYPYSRCKMESIQTKDCKKFGFVMGAEKTFTAAEASITGLAIERISASNRNYISKVGFEGYDTTGWKFPTLEHLQYAKNAGIINSKDAYLYKDDNGKPQIVSLSAVPDTLDLAFKVKLLMITDTALSTAVTDNFQLTTPPPPEFSFAAYNDSSNTPSNIWYRGSISPGSQISIRLNTMKQACQSNSVKGGTYSWADTNSQSNAFVAAASKDRGKKYFYNLRSGRIPHLFPSSYGGFRWIYRDSRSSLSIASVGYVVCRYNAT